MWPFLFRRFGDVLFGTPGDLLDLFCPDEGTGSSNSIVSKNSRATTIIGLQEVHGKDKFFQAFQVLSPRFRFICDTCGYLSWPWSYCNLSLRQLRGRLGLVHPHWPAYPNGAGVILGDFNICDPEEGGSMCGTKHSPVATRERLSCSTLSFHTSVRLPNLSTPGEILQV